jgi:hypothetical protein
VICSGLGGFRGASWRLVGSLGLRLGQKRVGGRAVAGRCWSVVRASLARAEARLRIMASTASLILTMA